MLFVRGCNEFMDTQHDEREGGECHRQVQDLPQCPHHDYSILRRQLLFVRAALLSGELRDECNQVLDIPNVVSESRFHRWSHAERHRVTHPNASQN